jgi:arylsulfatase A-like enzyme
MARKRNGQPNVIVFFTDQQRWDSTGVHGNPLGLTPHFDRMASQGTHVYHSFTCQPVCGPARSCLQTGQYATETGCYRNGIHLSSDKKTLAHYFREAGYRTGLIGKWHLGSQHGQEELQAVPEHERGGYEEWLASNIPEFTTDAYHSVLYDNDNKPVKLPGYRADAFTDAAIRYIDRHQDDPFFLFIGYVEPHHQNHRDDYPAPDGYRERYEGGRWVPPDLASLDGDVHRHLGGYLGMIQRLDEALGRLFDALRSLNLHEDTIVLFSSDHACHFKTRNGEYKRSCHESSIRVPTAISGPGFQAGGQLRELVSLVDLTPTLLDAAGIPVPDHMQGRSILPLVKREKVDWPEEVFVQISESQIGRAVRTQRWKYGVTAPGFKGGEAPGAERYEEQYLYDLMADPYELNNLLGRESHREVADVLKGRLIRRMLEAGEPEAVIESAPVKIGRGQRRVSKEEQLM